MQALACLAAGVLTVTSHYLASEAVIQYSGHLLIVTAVVMLFSLFRYKWRRRITATVNISFSSILFMLTFTGIIVGIVGELRWYKTPSFLESQGLTESLFITVLLAVYVWVCVFFCILVIKVIVLIVRRRKQIFSRMRRIASFDGFDFKSEMRTARRVVFQHIILFILIFLLAGVLSFFSKAVPPNNFWGVSLCLTFVWGVLSLRLPTSYKSLLPEKIPRIVFSITILLLIAGILYIWVILFSPVLYWTIIAAIVTWLICAATLFLP